MSLLKKPIIGDCGNVFTRKVVEQGECGIEGSHCNIITLNDNYNKIIIAVKEKCATCEYRNVPVAQEVTVSHQ
jgi:hypothetical protein